MGNNILDKPAMESVAKMEKDLAIIASTVDRIPDIERMLKELSVTSATSVVELDAISKDLSRRIEEFAQRCPYREEIASGSTRLDRVERLLERTVERQDGSEGEIKSMKTSVGDLKDGISVLERADRNNNIFATIASLIGTLIGSAVALFTK